MAGTHDPQDPEGWNGPQGPRGPGDARGGGGGPGAPGGPAGPGGAPGADSPFGSYEPPPGYGPARQYPDPYGGPGGHGAPERGTNGYNHDRRPPHRFSVLRLWAGGVAVALVAALAAAVAVLLVRGVLDIPVFAPETAGTLEFASTGQLALGAALAALAATAVLHLLLLATPQPGRFIGWIIALGTAAAMLAPFTSTASWDSKAGSAGVYLVIGLVIGTLMSTVARSATGPAGD